MLPVIKPPANVSLNAYKMLAIYLWQIESEYPSRTYFKSSHNKLKADAKQNEWRKVTDYAAEAKGHKKRVNALTQPLLNLKSNTMKNTLQM